MTSEFFKISFWKLDYCFNKELNTVLDITPHMEDKREWMHRFPHLAGSVIKVALEL